MASPPPPPFTIELSREVQAACRRELHRMAQINAVLLRATRRLRERLDAGGGPVRVTGRREALTLDLLLSPPDLCRVEAVTDGAPEPPASIVV